MGKTTFITYGDGPFRDRALALCRSARAVGFDEARSLGPDDLDPVFVKRNAATLSEPRGAGYWLWKPQIILQEVAGLSLDDVLIYGDAGRTDYYDLRLFPRHLTALARAHGFQLGPHLAQHGPLSRWTKRDCLVLMGMDRPDIVGRPLIQAGYNAWTNCAAARRFLERWIEWASDPRCLTDRPNECGLPDYPDFRDHRHDQSVLTLLCYKEGAPFLDFTSTGVYSILGVRPQSGLAQSFLKRIDDAEALARSPMPLVLLRGLRDYWTKIRRKA